MIPGGGYRLAPQQRRLWRLGAMGEDAVARCALRLNGPLEPPRLRAALIAVAARHPALRTMLRPLPGLEAPVQAVAEEAAPVWGEAALDRLAGPVRRTAVERLWRALGRSGSDAGRPPLAATLAALGAGEHLLLLAAPAVVADARSLLHTAGELVAVYGGATPAEEPLGYPQVAEWRNQTLAEAPGGEPPGGGRSPSPFPIVPDETAAAGAAAAAATRILDHELLAAAETLAAAHEVPAEAVHLAAWQALLHRLSGEPELRLAWAAAGREHAVLAAAVGPLAVRLPLDLELGERAAGGRGLGGLARSAAAAMRTAAAGLGAFDAAGDGDDAEPPPLPVVFEHQARPWSAAAGALRVALERLAVSAERPRLHLAVTVAAGAPAAELHYRRGGLPPAAAGRLLERWARLLAAGCAEPETPVGRLDLLAAGERRRVVVAAAVEPAPAAEPAAATLHGRLARQAERTPDRVAVSCGDRCLSYAALAAGAWRLAHRLRQLGVRSGALVGIAADRSPETVIGVFGILAAGAAYVPLDPTHPRRRLAALLAECGIVVVVAPRSLAAVLPDAGVERLAVDRAPAADDDPVAPAAAALPDGLAYVLHTSGSTGRPKGVMVEHRAAVALADGLESTVYRRLGEVRRVSLNAPLAFDASVKQLVQLLHGRTLVLIPDEVRADGRRLAAYLVRHRVEVADSTPSQLATLPGGGAPAAVGEMPRALLVGGEALPAALWGRLAAAAPGREAFNLYGPTECTVDATVCRVADRRRPSLGEPLPHVGLYLVSDAGGEPRPVPEGARGEIALAGAGVSRGYLGRPAATAERFRPDPFAARPGARLYLTGDRAARLADGTLRFLGRGDHQVKLHGVRVELGEIETTLERHPAVSRAVAAVRDGGDGPVLAAWVVPLPPPPAGLAAELRAFLRRRLPEAMVPSALAVIDRLPLDRRGKPDRAALPDPAAAAVAGPPRRPPQSDLERVVAAVWSEVLGRDEFGVEDNFFDVGGSSLRMIEVHHRLGERFGRAPTVVELFRFPTVRALAGFLNGGGGAAAGLDEVAERARRQRQAQQRRALAHGGGGGDG